jgi:formate-dependent nitrite reductase membrane component NrfD
MERYRVYSITNDSIWLGIGIIGIIVGIFLSFKLKKKYKKWSDDPDNDDEDVTLVTTLFACGIGALFIICIVLAAINLTSLLKWCFIPEVQFYGVVKGLIS